uniref:TATA-binding protein interacting (TIP20) domain-containing protein n=1 Tax=Percolomonas cosmopolitus TaxID=63605 RepID=A0A7S1PFX6_9EUKA|mmetsp:Transcript_11331/g.42472  ORF Transcript_11331/g.42472 Transcript_11331/m.42472 type:complete len:1223 (+) Transcript_11331:144-3812(+)
MSSFSVASILDKSKDDDPDLRSMAMIDLQQEIQKDSFKLDETSQKHLTDVILKLLEDETSKVRGAASECLKHFVRKLSQSLIEETGRKLADQVTKGEEEKREFASNALKTVIAQIPSANSDVAVRRMAEPLIAAAQSEKTDIQQDSLEILNDIIIRFGVVLTQKHATIQNICIDNLESQHRSIRKRCVKALANLSVNTNDQLFETLVKAILQKIESGDEQSAIRTYIQLTSSIAKKAGHRLGKFLPKIVNLLMSTAEKISEEEGEDEVREYILEAMELLVVKCPEEVKPYIDLIVILSKENIEYDPNYSYDTTDEDEMEDEELDEDEDDEMDEGEYSDDDDISWKVRKAAAKCLISIIKSRPAQLKNLFTELLEDEDFDLTSRFKEREDSVKLQIFDVFKALLSQSVTISTTSEGTQIIHPKTETKFVKDKKMQIIARLKKQLSTKNAKIKLGVFQVFNSLASALQGELSDQIRPLFAAVKSTLAQATDQDIQLKLEVLTFLRTLLTHEKPEAFTLILEDLTKTVYTRVDDKYYKIIAEALRVCQVLVHVLDAHRSSSFFKAQADALFKNISAKLQVQDIDQDVKEASIAAMGDFISVLGQDTSGDTAQTLSTLLDRLRNEITRLGTCRALNEIAASKFDVSPVLDDVLNELSNYLRKFNRSLRQASLTCLRTMVLSYHSQIKAKQYDQIINEMSNLVSDSDLNLAHLSLKLATAILTNHPESAKKVQQLILPKALGLLESNTLQGSALRSLVEFFRSIAKNVGFSTLLKNVLQTVQSTSIVKQVYTNVGRTTAALVDDASGSDKKSTIQKFVANLKSSNLSTRILAFFTLGEIGRTTDLISFGNIEEDIQQCFQSESEEVKHAASYCLGNVAIGNLEHFLPSIIKKITTNESERYLLMHALKNIIVQADAANLKKFSGDILPLLFQNSANEEEGIRNVVSECLGKLTVVDYDAVMSKLKSSVPSDNDLEKSTVVAAVKFAISERGTNFDQKLKADLPAFLDLLSKQEPVSVRKTCVLLLTSAARNNPTLIEDRLDRYLPALYAESVFDPSLVTVVDLGPFKHKVDGGIELRKSAFECMDTILTNLHNRVDPTKFVAQLAHGLSDGDKDINMLTYHIIVKCTDLFPREILLVVDELVPPITKLLKKKLGEKALQQDRERHEELQKASLKAVYAMSTIDGISDMQSFAELKTKTIGSTLSLSGIYDEIANERNNTLTMMDLSQ